MTQNIPLLNACRFYYNRQLEGCLPFLYSGCSANENNFETKLDCELRCAGIIFVTSVGNLLISQFS